MSLRTYYGDNIIALTTDDRGDGCHHVEGWPWVIIDTPDSDEYNPVALEIMFIDSHMPLETNGGYCSGTDTLVIGKSKDTATLVKRNGDLVAYWSPEEYDPDDLSLVAVALHNASKHLTPAIADHVNKPEYEAVAGLH